MGSVTRIMWLEVASTNNDPRFVAKYFLDTIRQIKGAPSIVRADYGTENVKVAGIQRFLRRDGTDSFAGIYSFMYGKSESCLLYTSPSPRDLSTSRMPSSA